MPYLGAPGAAGVRSGPACLNPGLRLNPGRPAARHDPGSPLAPTRLPPGSGAARFPVLPGRGGERSPDRIGEPAPESSEQPGQPGV